MNKLLIVIFSLILWTPIIASDRTQKLDSLFKTLNTAESDTQKLKILVDIGGTYNYLSDYNDGILFEERAILMADSLIGVDGNKNIIQTKCLQQKAIAIYNLGFAKGSLGNENAAIDNFFMALKIGETIEDSSIIANSYNLIGGHYFNARKYDEALKYFSLYLRLKQTQGIDKPGIATGYNNVGAAYAAQQQNTKALLNYNISFKLQENLKDYQGAAMSLKNIGVIFQGQGKMSDALSNYWKAFDYQKKAEINNQYGFICLNLASLFLDLNEFDKAILWADSGLVIGNKTMDRGLLENANTTLSEIFVKLKNFKKAFAYYKSADSIHDLRYTESTEKNLSNLRIQYETDKKDKEIQLLNNLNVIKEQETLKQKQIKKIVVLSSLLLITVLVFAFYNFSRKRKEIFRRNVEQINNRALRSQMNPHFIFNSLNSIDDYIQNNDIDNSSLYVNKFSKLMRIILESSRQDEIPLFEDLEALELYIQLENLRMKNKVDYKINIDENVNVEQTLIPPLLLQPFVENTFKHAFQNIPDPKLEIEISKKKEMLHCIVVDNGRGREVKQEMEIKTKNKKESLGLRVTQERLEIFNKIKKTHAFIKFEDLKDYNHNSLGTKVELVIPALYSF